MPAKYDPVSCHLAKMKCLLRGALFGGSMSGGFSNDIDAVDDDSMLAGDGGTLHILFHFSEGRYRTQFS
jgi:hypothetical protein